MSPAPARARRLLDEAAWYNRAAAEDDVAALLLFDAGYYGPAASLRLEAHRYRARAAALERRAGEEGA